MIGNNIKKRRIQIGLTQQQLADMTGIKKNTISNYENDVSSPSEENILKIMAALKCDANYLFNKEEDTQLSVQAAFTEKEVRNMIKYRTLDRYGKKAVDDILNVEYDRCITQTEPLNEKPICECGYTPSLHGAQFTHEEYHQRYENAVKKFGVYYPQTVHDKIYKEMDAILATNPDLDTQIKCQTEILKCCFSESLQLNNFDLRHCKFKEYVAMVLCQHTPAIPMSTECVEAMAGTSKKGYGKQYGMSEGIIYTIPKETPEEKRIRLIIESIHKLNEAGQLMVLDCADDLATSGKYKPDPDDEEND